MRDSSQHWHTEHRKAQKPYKDSGNRTWRLDMDPSLEICEKEGMLVFE